MAFFLFLVVNATLFIRPGEIVPAMFGWEIYFWAILACFLLAMPDMLRYFTGQAPQTEPVTLSVFGLLASIMIAPVVAGQSAEVWRCAWPFAKVLVYYVLFVSLVTTPGRLRALLFCILACCAVATSIAILRYYDVIQLNTIETLHDSGAGRYGEAVTVRRLQTTGIFQDPNDLCVMLAGMTPISLYFVFRGRNLLLQGLCAAMTPLFGYAVYLTHSRGGFLSFASGLAALSWARFGWKKSALLGVVGVPLLLVAFAGRQTEISLNTGTAQTRIELWREWLTEFRMNPLVGSGMSAAQEDEQPRRRAGESLKHLAHNSYLQAFADLGILGGCLFVGAVLTALWSIARFQGPNCLFLDGDVQAARPYIFAGVAAYAVGMMTLSLNYILPTYLMLALSVAYTRIARRSCLHAPPPLSFDPFLLACYLAAGICTLGSIYVFVRFLA